VEWIAWAVIRTPGQSIPQVSPGGWSPKVELRVKTHRSYSARNSTGLSLGSLVATLVPLATSAHQKRLMPQMGRFVGSSVPNSSYSRTTKASTHDSTYPDARILGDLHFLDT
jgi:hypothetical protein